MKRDRTWDCETDEHMFRALIGEQYGDRPQEQIERIRQDKKHIGDLFGALLDFGLRDRVIDLGSGTGFVARHVAPLVERLYCLDISTQFHEFCKKELAPFENTTCQLIGYADFSSVEGCGINKVFASGVFIHFNIYDLVSYLRAIHGLLPTGGMLAFDFADGEILDIDKVQNFVTASTLYRQDRQRFLGLMNWNGLGVVRNLAAQIGFEVGKIWFPYESNCYILLKKKA